jgi:GT2 family glycosyltransferase
LYEHGFLDKEVLIINNDQSEEEELRRVAEKYSVTLLASPGNVGFATAANQAAVAASGELLFFVNPDTEWREPLFSKIQEHFTNQTLGVLGIGLCSQEGLLEKGNGGNFLSWKSFFIKGIKPQSKPWTRGPFVASHGVLNLCYPSLFGNKKSFLFHSLQTVINKEPPGGSKKQIQEVAWVSGGALACRRESFTALKGFDQRFFMYFEDMDFCKRAKESGLSVLLDQSIALIHFRGKSHSSKKSQKKIYDTSLYLYIHKHWSPVERLPFLFLHKIYRFLYPYGR